MAQVRGKNTIPELTLRHALAQAGLRWRLHAADLPGKPDLVFRSARVAVFVDGDFWHGRVLIEHGRRRFRAQFKGPRREWWAAKIEQTVKRDRENRQQLEAKGWAVLVCWEKDLPTALPRLVRQIVSTVRRRADGRQVAMKTFTSRKVIELSLIHI